MLMFRRPAVTVLSTGDEVVEPTCTALGPGQIRDSNRCMLLAACTAAGAAVTDGGIVRDKVQHCAMPNTWTFWPGFAQEWSPAWLG
jgi:molybdopterin biosynthesis enzyme